jgi:CheY-like chemotaxis protein
VLPRIEEKYQKLEQNMSLTANVPVPPAVKVAIGIVPQILILDNDEYVLLNLERVLENQGYATATAMNYEQAAMLLSQHTFDLLVLDDHLSDRDSIRTVVDLRGSELIPPLVVVTYHRPPPDGEQARLRILGVSALINKLAHDELAQTIREMLGA